MTIMSPESHIPEHLTPEELSGSAYVEENPEDAYFKLVDHFSAEDISNDDKLQALIDLNPEVQIVTSELVNRRGIGKFSKDVEAELVGNVRLTRNDVERKIKERLGIIELTPEEQERRNEIERLKKLGEILGTLSGHENDEELLVKFGLMGDDGQMTTESMNSPLFKIDTRAAFKQYIDYAIQFDALQEAEAMSGTPVRNIGEANTMRRQAHNIVSKFVQRDLGLSFEDSRRFVAKSREAIFPGTHEKGNYARLIRGQKLGERYGHDALEMTRDKLKNIIESPMAHELDENLEDIEHEEFY